MEYRKYRGRICVREMPNKDIIIHTTNWLVPAAGGLLNPNNAIKWFSMPRDGQLCLGPIGISIIMCIFCIKLDESMNTRG